jgi:hypothetical protein
MICQKCPAKIPLMRIDGNTKKALALRLKFILEQEQNAYSFWKEHVKPKMKPSKASIVERYFRQKIQSLKIVIWILTPSTERHDDFPGYWRN